MAPLSRPQLLLPFFELRLLLQPFFSYSYFSLTPAPSASLASRSTT